MQTILEKLIKKLDVLKTLEQRSLISYIITTSKNTAYNYCRDLKPIISLSDEVDTIPDPNDNLDDRLIKEESLLCLHHVWESLDEKTRYLLSARYILGKSLLEIASDLNISPNNIRMAMVRARKKAKHYMKEFEENNS